MIKYTHGVLGNQHESSQDVVVFSDEGEVFDFVQKLKLEADALKRGTSRMKEGTCVDVEFQGGSIHADVLVDLHPSYSEWRCPLCKGELPKCSYCGGDGWDTSGESNGFGVFCKKLEPVKGTALFVLCHTEYWEEEEEEEEEDECLPHS